MASVALVALAAHPTPARADHTEDELARFRAELADDNPAELWQQRGATLWLTPAGPRHAALDTCDLGLGPGVVTGAFARLPRWFADAGQVMDLEQRLMWCMRTLQGLDQASAARDHFGDGSRTSALEALSAWIAAQSAGMAVEVAATHPEEQRLLSLGQRLFWYRAGPYDFACASCHAGDDQRIRLQALPNLTRPQAARQVWPSWPAYRISQGELRTMQHRLYDCLRQQRWPEPVFGSELVTALSLYMAHQAQGGTVTAPALKR